MFDFGRTNAEGQSTEGAVSGRMRISANQGCAGQRETALRSHDMHNPLTRIAQTVERDAKVLTVGHQRRHLLFGKRHACVKRGLPGRDVVVHRREHQVGTTELAAGCAQTSESLRTRDFMNDVTVNVKQRQFAGLLHHHVGVINLFVECFSHGIHLSVRPDGGRSHRPFRAC